LIVSIVIVVFHVLGFLSSIHAVMSTRTSQGAIAWVVSLNTFPYVAVPAYWVLGRSKFQGYVTARQQGDLEIQHIVRNAAKEASEFRSAEMTTGAARAAELLAEMPTVKGNTVELLIDGDATFASIFKGIDAAEEYVLVQFFIVKDDGLGRELQARLIAKARDGVRVFFLYDEIGSYKLPKKYLIELREAGVEAAAFHSRRGPRNHFQINFRNHRKVVVVDGHTAWIGGHNVGDEYLGKGPLGAWRDTHMKIDGPAAVAAQLSFFEDWHWATDGVPDFNWMPQHVAEDGVDVLIVPSGPADRLETAGLMFVHAINSAQRRIWIASPYFVPDEAVMAALQLAGLRGVDVRILIPDEPDHLLVYLAAFSYFDEAGSTGVDFYRYTDGFLHQKTMLIDESAAAVGTANFDNRSFRLNFEITALVADNGFASEVEQMFLEDFKRSRLMQPGDYNERGFWFKLAVRLARLSAPVQ
jgi:cardiolipin synthase